MIKWKHTKGPWSKAERLNGPFWHIASNYSVGGEYSNTRQAIASVCGESKRGAIAYAEMFEANAKLIAASPELLDVVVMCLHEFEKHGVQIDKEVLMKIRDVVLKATGHNIIPSLTDENPM